MGNSWKWIVFALALVLIIWGLWSLMSSKDELRDEVAGLKADDSELQTENRELKDQVDYLAGSDANLIKVFKEQTSYRFPDEKLIIIVPGTNGTSTPTSTATSTGKN
jgi:hypothetical protein